MAGILSGLRVVELAEDVAGPYVTKLLSDLGADVMKVEEPGGDRARAIGPFVGGEPGEDRSVLFLHLNTSKRSVQLDTSTPEGARHLAGLVGTAELLVTDRSLEQLARLGLDVRPLASGRPPLVTLSVTPFGWDGPRQDHRAAPLTTFHGAGEGYLTPVASHLMPEVVDRPPLRQGRFASEYKLATYAATLALAAVFHARATGRGQTIDLSKQDALIGLNFFEFTGFLTTGEVPTRASLAVPFGGIARCKDGYLQFTFHEEHQWRALVRMMGDPDWAQSEWAASEASRLGHADEINARLSEFLSSRTRAEVVDAGQAMGVTVAPYHAVDEMVDSPQIIERGYLQEVTHPVAGTCRYPTGPWRFAGEPPRPGPAPRLGQHTVEILQEAAGGEPRGEVRSDGRAGSTGTGGALAGVRILDFTWAVAGPTATMQAASLGAEVIKVETRLRLDVLRRNPPMASTINRQKRAVTLNLRHPAAVELAKRLVAVSDVVAESFRPGVMNDLGLGYEDLRQVKPDIIMLSSSMAGQHGPYSRFAGYAPMFVALSGLGDMTGYPDGPPTQIRVGGDIIVGVHGGFALLAALVHYQATGRGVHIDLSSIEAQSNLIGDSILEYTVNGDVPRRRGNREPFAVPHNCFRCRGDDRWVSIAVRTDGEWKGMVAAMGRPAWAGDPRYASVSGRDRHAEEIEERVAAWTAALTADEVAGRLQAEGVPADPSYRAPELFADPHVASRGLVATVPGEGQDWTLLRLGGRLSGTPLVLDRAGPAMGEDNDDIFGSLLDLSPAEIKQLEAEGVFT
jgi:crotonobetainyl-CoA:carnitine CoA-transferase CaiB-like acyl-CoA transferase